MHQWLRRIGLKKEVDCFDDCTVRRCIQILCGLIALLPCGVWMLRATEVLGDSAIVKVALVACFPAVSIFAALETFNLPAHVNAIALIALMLGWAWVMAVLLWKMAATMLGDDAPDGHGFDWHGFRVRFMVGALLGLLFGWRLWIRMSEHASLLVCMIVTALITGFVLGMAWRDNFWRRPI